jgi:thioredoxin 1
MSAELTRSEVDGMQGQVVLEFGAAWCPICQGARPLIDRALAAHSDVRHLRVEDGKGKPLGRSFLFLRDGTEVARVVRPSDDGALSSAFGRLGSTG